MSNAPSITIGTEKQRAYANDIFAKKGDHIRAQRASLSKRFAMQAKDCAAHLGATIPHTDVVVTAAVIERCNKLATDFSGGAEHHAVYWIEDAPFMDKLDKFAMTGAVSEKMARMGIGI